MPQGSILGPLLFIFFIDDICDLPLSKDSTLTLYADDICYSRPICNVSFAIVQRNIDLIGNWSNRNFMKISVCGCLSPSNLRTLNVMQSINLFVNATKLNRVSEVKFLGVLTTHNLNWAVHIHSVVSKQDKNPQRTLLDFLISTAYLDRLQLHKGMNRLLTHVLALLSN